MPPVLDIGPLAVLIFLAAALYSSVGHAGASGYVAAMALFGVPPAIMKPTALVLNVLVATLGTFRWQRQKLLDLKGLAPFAVTSVPFAFIGGAIQLPPATYRFLIGVLLLIAAWRLLFQFPVKAEASAADTSPPPVVAGLIGAGVGLLSGLTGTGGGIFLSPILLFLGWAGPRRAAAITAPFILVNSVAGLAGNLVTLRSLPGELPILAAAAFLGGLVGTQVAVRWGSGVLLQRLLGLVLLIAGLKFIWV